MTAPPPPACGRRQPGWLARAALLGAYVAWAFAALHSHARAEEPAPAKGVLAHLETWLGHEDWSLRSLAAFDLARVPGPGTAGAAARALVAQRQPFVDALLLRVLEAATREELVEEGGCALVSALLARFDDPHPIVRQRSRTVLARLPTMALPLDLERYRAWWRVAERAYGEESVRLAAASREAREARRARPKLAEGTETSDAHGVDDRFYTFLEQVRRDGLETCVLLDHTGSMAGMIAQAKAQARLLIERISQHVPNFRAGLVTYDDRAMLRIALTSDAKTLEKAFRRVGAAGGGDYEEGVDQAVYLAMRQDVLGWSRKAQRVLVVVGDAPPHDEHVQGLLRAIRTAREDPLFDHALLVHTVSTADAPVPYFEVIAHAGGGRHVNLGTTGSLVEELLALVFGGIERERLRAWMDAIDELRAAR